MEKLGLLQSTVATVMADTPLDRGQLDAALDQFVDTMEELAPTVFEMALLDSKLTVEDLQPLVEPELKEMTAIASVTSSWSSVIKLTRAAVSQPDVTKQFEREFK